MPKTRLTIAKHFYLHKKDCLPKLIFEDMLKIYKKSDSKNLGIVKYKIIYNIIVITQQFKK